jgi:hypothetical protein
MRHECHCLEHPVPAKGARLQAIEYDDIGFCCEMKNLRSFRFIITSVCKMVGQSPASELAQLVAHCCLKVGSIHLKEEIEFKINAPFPFQDFGALKHLAIRSAEFSILRRNEMERK